MEQIAEKKKAILETTLELIKEHGFHGTPMSLVAKKAGVAAGTIYHYFESKDELICEVFSYIMQKATLALHQGGLAEMSYKDKFFNLWVNLYEFYRNNPNVLVFFEQFVNSPYNAIIGHGCQDQIRTYLYNFLAEGVSKAYLRPVNPEVLSVLVLGNVITTAKIMRLQHVKINDEELQQIREIIWDGMAAS